MLLFNYFHKSPLYFFLPAFIDQTAAINLLTSPGEGITVFTSPYLSAGASALGEAKGLIEFIDLYYIILKYY